MSSLVGFTLCTRLVEKQQVAARAAQTRALTHFPHLQIWSLEIGETHLDVWGHKAADDRLCTLPDGSMLALIGSPVGEVAWPSIAANLQDPKQVQAFTLPWDGRVILLHISADGQRWTLWNDWLGSIPVFHAEVENGRLASTLEPVTVSGAGFTSDDFFMPGLVSLLINGHYLSDWTLYKGMKVIPPDSMITWDKKGFSAKQLWTVEPSQSRWEAGWDDLVDEMYELSRKAITETLASRPAWNMPLSSGLDSRLIAGVAADAGVEVRAYAWGGKNTTDVKYSREIAQTLGLPWKHIELRNDFLREYTPRWFDLFGSALNVHGMYQMCFLDTLKVQSDLPVISGFVGDTLAGDAVDDSAAVHGSKSYQLGSDWYSNWTDKNLKPAAKFALPDALEANAQNLQAQIESYPGARFQKLQYLELWNRQRFFTNFSSTLIDYWTGAGAPYINREYARFALSLPRVVLDNRRLLRDVFRRYYGPLAVIPGTYAKDPLILTGKYLLLRRAAEVLPPFLHLGPLRGFGNVQLRMDIESVQATGKAALWPLFEMKGRLAQWIDMDQLEKDYQTIMRSKKDVRPLRRLQSVQTLAYRLMDSWI